MRKADLMSLIIVVGFLAVLVIGGMLFSGLFMEMGTELKSTITNSGITGDALNNSLAAADVMETDAPNYVDNFMFWFLMAVCLGMMVSGLFLDFEAPIVIILLIFSSIAIYLSTLVSNFYDELANEATLAASAQSMTMSSAVFGSALPVIIFVSFIVTLIIMYSKKSGGNNGF